MKRAVPYPELITVNETDFSLEPERFYDDERGGAGHLALNYVWGLVPLGKDEPPAIFIRMVTDSAITPLYGCNRCGDTPELPQVDIGKTDKMHGSDTFEYKTVSGDPEGLTQDKQTYEYKLDNPLVHYRFSSGHMRMSEGDFADFRFDFLPYAVKMMDTDPTMGTLYLAQHAVISGTFDGKPVQFMGGYDRVLNYPTNPMTSITIRPMLICNFCGRRPDGRLEDCFVSLIDKDSAVGYYWLEGEEPIFTQEIAYHGDWKPLPYANDGTVIPLNLTFRFGGKTIHYTAKWGFRGEMKEPTDRQGFANTAGTWYEGDTHYEMDLVFATTENWAMTVDTLRKNDF